MAKPEPASSRYVVRPPGGDQAAPSPGPAALGTEGAPAPPASAVRVTVERITYQNEENGYTVAKVVRESDGAVLAHGTGSFAIFPR